MNQSEYMMKLLLAAQSFCRAEGRLERIRAELEMREVYDSVKGLPNSQIIEVFRPTLGKTP